jgi:hypothetical protein
VSTLLFFWPALKHGSIDAGLLYGGDVLAFYLPAIMKTHSLLSSFHFVAIDYSLFNGSSDFFLSPNFFAVHPLIVIYSLLAPLNTSSLQSAGQFLVLLLATHSFLACYFSIKLFTRFFYFELGMAFLVAAGFAFSWYMIASLNQPPFLFCASIIPWAIYSALCYSENPSPGQLIRGSLPVVIGLLGGYLPLGIACLALAAAFIIAKVLFIDAQRNSITEKLIESVLRASLPFFLGLLITSPYLYAAFKFHHTTSSSQTPSLFYSAHQLAELPQAFIRILSPHFQIPRPIIEFSVFWGVIPLTIFAIFFLGSRTLRSLNPHDWKLFKFAGILYFATVLATYGAYSSVSSLVYYFVPQIGTMHIYQRFLLPAQLLLMIMVALMLKALAEKRPDLTSRFALVFIVLITFTCGVFLTYQPTAAAAFGINNFLLFELILGCLFAGMLLIPGKAFIYYGTVVLLSLPGLTQIYNYSQGSGTLAIQQTRQPMALDSQAQTQFLNYLRRFNNKKVIKYVDITPLWNESGIETFPKDFPYFVLNRITLSSYGGATFYLSALGDYMRRMPVGGENVEVKPDWQWLKDTGADFIIATETQLSNNELLNEIFNKNKPEDIYKLPNNAIVIPLELSTKENHLQTDIPLFDNGYFSIFPSTHTPSASWTNLAIGKTATQSSDGGGRAQLAIDGNTDGDFSHGSVTHTRLDPNAWLEVDLGKIEQIDSVRIWNRTDCCGERLRDYHVFISNQPFLPTDTVTTLHSRDQTWEKIGAPAQKKYTIDTGNIQGRYVRIQLSGKQPNDQNYLSLAEVEILKFKKQNPTGRPLAASIKNYKFYSNNANYMRFDFDADRPTLVQYLFWNNPRLKYYLNGKKLKPANIDGLQFINAPSGRNKIEVYYNHKSLGVFWFFYAIFTLSLLFTFLPKHLQQKVRLHIATYACRIINKKHNDDQP